ncbi:MAG: T9SS type A sorting domain-containing protein, partial [bacterium]|nr:T9SS type A sorting domain-containing protein [bacterium]
AILGTYAYVADSYSGLQVIDITNPASPQIVGSVNTPGSARGVAISGTYAYVAGDYAGLQVIDITNPASPQIVGGVDTPGNAVGVTISGTYAYVADYEFGLQVIDIANPASPQIVGSVDTPNYANGVAIMGACAYVANYSSGLQVIDITDPASPQIVGSVNTPGFARGVAISGPYAYVADGESGFQVIDITNPASPQIVGGAGTPGNAVGVTISGTNAYVVDGIGLQVLPAQCDEPQAVYLSQLHAVRHGGEAVVHWEYSLLRAHAGFHVWREEPGSGRVQLSLMLLSGQVAYDFVDPAPPTGTAEYWLQEMTTDGSENWYGPAHLEAATIPAAMHLAQNHPNPFNPSTSFTYRLPQPGRAVLAIYDVRGARVASLVDASLTAGEHRVEWTGMTDVGTRAPSGVYFARLETELGARTVKVTLTK